MGGPVCVARKRRKHPFLDRTGPAFERAIHNKDYETAAKIALAAALVVGGGDGIMWALHRANSYIRRREARGTS